MAVLDDIEDIFSIFHDGVIESYNGNVKVLTLTVNCQYLAELINPTFTKFYIRLENISMLNFTTWPNPLYLPVLTLTDLKDIFESDLEILSVDIESNDFVNIACNQHDMAFDYCGGNLKLSCDKIEIFDEEFRRLTIDELDVICKYYWNKFGRGLD
jgi:hypothetical protein